MSTDLPKSQNGDPTWEIATLFPRQGEWTVAEYLDLNTNQLIELSDGQLEFLPVPTELHQLIALYLWSTLRSCNAAGIGLVSPFRVRVSSEKFREPDVMFMLDENRDRRHEAYWDGADLVMEVVSNDDPKRDLETKRFEYAQAGISEYWIVDPRDQSVLVLALDAGATEYREAGRYSVGQIASSELLKDFQVSVDDVFNQPQA